MIYKEPCFHVVLIKTALFTEDVLLHANVFGLHVCQICDVFGMMDILCCSCTQGRAISARVPLREQLFDCNKQ